jgi:hypothetical protein
VAAEFEKQHTVSGGSTYWNLEDEPQVSQNLLLCGDMWGGVGGHHFQQLVYRDTILSNKGH